MNFKLLILITTYLIASGHFIFAQTKFSKIEIDKQFKDTLSFVKQWDYPNEVIKDDSTGEFSKMTDGPLTAADTAHLFFTAKCSTNVQGGYEIRYCFANKSMDNIRLTFSDGLPAYASEYYIYIKGDSFYFRPKTIYPARYPGEKISYQVIKQKLTLNKSSYAIGETVIGYVDAEFIETVSVPKKGSENHKFYLKGFIKTKLNRETKNGR
jgi:hypothetical protein